MAISHADWQSEEIKLAETKILGLIKIKNL